MDRLRIKIFRWKYLFIAIPLVVYLTSLTQYWICSNDSAMYIYQGRAFLQTGIFMQNGQARLVASPGFPALLAGIMSIFGESNYFAMQLGMLLCGLAGLAVVYRQRWIWTSRFQARLVVFATAMSFYFYHNTRRVLTEAPSFLLFWVIVALLRAAKTNKWCLAGAALAGYAAIVMRVPAVLPIAAVGAAALLERQLISEKFRWRFFGSGVLAMGLGAGWFHVKLIAQAYQQAAPYAPAPSRLFRFTDAWFVIVDNIGRLFSDLALAQRNGALGWAIIALMTLAAWRCYKHRGRGLVFPAVFLVIYAALMISAMNSWTMMPRYWFYVLPFVIYYIFKSFELLGSWLTKLARLSRPMLPLPKFAALLIVSMLLIQLPLIVRNNAAALASWGGWQEQFYKKHNRGRDAEIMALAGELAGEKSRQWIAASEKSSILIAFSGRYVHSLRKKPMEVIRSRQWQEHPPEVVLLRRPKPKDAIGLQKFRQLIGIFGNNKNWTLDKETKRWLVFRRKMMVRPK